MIEKRLVGLRHAKAQQCLDMDRQSKEDFFILCFNLAKGLTTITKICLASLGVMKNILKLLVLGVAA